MVIKMEKLVEGIVTALITPLVRSGELCVECLESILNFQISRSVGGLFLTGTYGEGVILPQKVRQEVYRRVLEFPAGGREKLLMNIL